MQINDKAKRGHIAKEICTLLIYSYTKTSKKKEALEVTAFYELQKELIEGR
jgi:hypothetical protein